MVPLIFPLTCRASAALDFREFNVVGQAGKKALKLLLDRLVKPAPRSFFHGQSRPQPVDANKQDALVALSKVAVLRRSQQRCSALKPFNSGKPPVSTFFNRLLGCSVSVQNWLFAKFEKLLGQVQLAARLENRDDSAMAQLTGKLQVRHPIL